MVLRRLIVTTSSVCVMALAAGLAAGQDYPAKPVRIITSAPGGSSDFAARVIAPGLTTSLGQQAIVDNRGNFGGEILSKAPADGYTVLLEGFSLWLGTLLQPTARECQLPGLRTGD